MSKQIFYLLPFIFGIISGIILIYMYKDQKIDIIQYPKPFDTTIFKDKNNMDFIYTTKEVNCDSNEKNLVSYPLQ